VTSSLDESVAFETWSAVIAPLFEPRPCGPRRKTPTGSVNGIIIRDLLIARVAFNAQDFARDEQRISTTPDHLLLHLYQRGGFTGAISGQQASIGPGKVAIIDLSYPVNTRAFASNTLSLIVPKKLLADEALKAIKPKLDPFRNDLLAAYIVSLKERSAQLTQADVNRTVNETADFLNRLFVCASSEKVSFKQQTDETLVAMSEALIRDNLALPELSPDWLAGRLSVSRASLYRLFEDRGGIMRYVQERRLLAVQAALSDPLENRRLSRLAADLGFKSEAHFSRSFRARFGITASAYRKAQLAAAAAVQLTNPTVVHQWWTTVSQNLN
ncbi:helix-turn-helix domain-containing protein, partial [Rhodopseudomonas sp. B29]|uniref:helix-turn-helix domain-containing protein n=1 Tax=Rhodopseudomonas sp. B29 TaxID=95607 RepID=UPI0003B5DAF2